jgi:hypothetical protein
MVGAGRNGALEWPGTEHPPQEVHMLRITSAAGFDSVNYRAAALSMLAGVVHGIATVYYLPAWWGYGIFFIVAALGQVAYGGVLLFKPWQYDETGGIRVSGTGNARTFYMAGLILTIAFIALYLITRTLGVPLMGPLAGVVEPFDPLGLLTQAIHVVLAIHLYALARYAGSAATNP